MDHHIVSVEQGRLIAAPPRMSRIWIVTCVCGWWGEPHVFGLHVHYALVP